MKVIIRLGKAKNHKLAVLCFGRFPDASWHICKIVTLITIDDDYVLRLYFFHKLILQLLLTSSPVVEM